MKKIGMLLAALSLAITMTAPSLAESTPVPEAPTFAWERDAQAHWHVQENGEKTDVAAHALTEGVCVVCGSEILTDEEGWTEVSSYNEHGDLTRSTSFDPTGAVIYDCTIDYAYDEQGNMLWEREFDGETLMSEATYMVDADGLHHLAYAVSYDEDGGMTRADYDENENIILLCTYAADGTLTYEENNEYALDENGWYYLIKSTAKLEDGTTLISEYNERRDWLRAAIVEADGTISSDTTYAYVYEGDMKKSCKIFESGVLTMEEIYDENGWLIQEIEHLQDGTTNTYDYHYDAQGELID